MFLLPSALMGIGQAGMWGPLATTATRNLEPRQAGAGAGIYNTTRTIGSVLGSAAIAAFMQARLEANLPGAGDAGGDFGSGQLPDSSSAASPMRWRSRCCSPRAFCSSVSWSCCSCSDPRTS
jgi:MFS family permease